MCVVCSGLSLSATLYVYRRNAPQDGCSCSMMLLNKMPSSTNEHSGGIPGLTQCPVVNFECKARRFQLSKIVTLDLQIPYRMLSSGETGLYHILMSMTECQEKRSRSRSVRHAREYAVLRGPHLRSEKLQDRLSLALDPSCNTQP